MSNQIALADLQLMILALLTPFEAGESQSPGGGGNEQNFLEHTASDKVERKMGGPGSKLDSIRQLNRVP